MSKFISKLASSLEAMLDYREALGFSRQTHLSALMHFDRYCAGFAPDATTISKDMVLGWLNGEIEKSRSNINEKAAAVRLFGRYLAATGVEAYLIPATFISQKKDAANPYIFTDSELTALFNATDSFPKSKSDNNSLIAPVLFRLIYTCGLRPNDGRELEYANVNLETGEIFITKTKRKKERLVVMSDDMLALCRRYDRQRGAFGSGSKFFFPGQNGEAYTEQQLLRLFKRCWEDANPTVPPDELPDIRIYDLRHRFASAILNRWLDEKRDLYVMLPYLQAYMGHKSISETAYYIHILPENLIKSTSIDWEAFEELMPEFPARFTCLTEKQPGVGAWQD